jgi:hypothetical protein
MAMDTPPLTGWVTKDGKRWIRDQLGASCLLLQRSI